MGDRALGGFGLVLAALFVWQATLIQESFMTDPVGPKGFPYIIGALLALSSIAIILRPDPAPHWPEWRGLAEIAIAVAVLLAYSQLLPDLGFVIATAFTAAYFSWRLGATPISAAVAGVAIALGIYVVFHLLLGLNLAKGPLGI